MKGDNLPLKQPVSQRRRQQHRPVNRCGRGRKIVFAHPCGDKRNQGQAEQQVQVGP